MHRTFLQDATGLESTSRAHRFGSLIGIRIPCEYLIPWSPAEEVGRFLRLCRPVVLEDSEPKEYAPDKDCDLSCASRPAGGNSQQTD